MKTYLAKFTLILLIISSSCSKEYELDKSIFIADKDYPSLPAYTEWGYNTFGALYDREPFVNTDFSVPTKIICTGGKTSFTLKGHLGESRYYYYVSNGKPIILNFDLLGFVPESLSDLIELNDTIIDLRNPLCKVSLTVDTAKYSLTILSGSLNFNRAQNLIVDKQQYEIILSGIFDFQALINNEPTSISMGRFDVGIANDNFFKY
jgi:hypothetical protein